MLDVIILIQTSVSDSSKSYYIVLDAHSFVNMFFTMSQNSEAFVAYDVLLMLEMDKDGLPHNFTLLNSSQIVGVPGCSDEDVTFTKLSADEIMLSPFNVQCIAIVWLQVQVCSKESANKECCHKLHLIWTYTGFR